MRVLELLKNKKPCISVVGTGGQQLLSLTKHLVETDSVE
jgi:hypothetical protein